MPTGTDPALLSTDERLTELADIFAAGILRMRARPLIPVDAARPVDAADSANSGSDCLEVPGDRPLSVGSGPATGEGSRT